MGKVTRKRYGADFKAKVALAAIKGELTLAELFPKHGIHQTMVAAWKRQAIEGLFRIVGDVMALGEGIETVSSLKSSLPSTPTAAALSATHLAAVHLPQRVYQIYIAHDNDHSGRHAAVSLTERAQHFGIDYKMLRPHPKITALTGSVFVSVGWIV